MSPRGFGLAFGLSRALRRSRGTSPARRLTSAKRQSPLAAEPLESRCMLATLTGPNPVPPPPLPVVSLAVSPAAVAEDGATNLTFTFTRTGTTAAPLTVKYGIAGTATRGTDYTVVGGTPGTVTFAAGAARATVTVDPTADTVVEPHETVALTLAAGSGYSIGTARAATGTITNDDAPAALPAATTVWAFNSGGNGSPPFDVTALPGYGVATSAVFYFSEGGWAG
jgi:hypothetical protein